MAYSWIITGVALLIMATVEPGAAIHCWVCNSIYDRRSGDPFDNTTCALVDCSAQNTQRLQSMGLPTEGQVCRKITQKVKGEYRVIRDCGYIIDRSSHATTLNPNGTANPRGGDFECVGRAGTFSVLMQYCSCTSDGCNAAHRRLRAGPLALVIPLLLIVAPLVFAATATGVGRLFPSSSPPVR